MQEYVQESLQQGYIHQLMTPEYAWIFLWRREEVDSHPASMVA